MGMWVKAALNTTVFACGLADKDTARQIPSYPQKPFVEENTAQLEQTMTEEQLKAERLRAYCFFKTLGRYKK